MERTPIDLAAIEEKNLDYALSIQDRRNVYKKESIKSIDPNLDGQDEIIFISNSQRMEDPSYVQISSPERSKIWFRNNYQGQIYLPVMLDLDKDRRMELVFSESRVDTTLIHLIDDQGDPVADFIAAANPNSSKRKWSCSCSDIAAMDINQDGYLDLIYTINTTYAYQPRGIGAYDVRNDSLLWDYLTGYSPYGLFLIDFDQDGRREIIAGASAPQNGIGQMVNGTDDETVYFAMLDSLGRLKISYRFEEQYNLLTILPYTLHKDRAIDLYFLASSFKDNTKNKSVIGIIDKTNGRPAILQTLDHLNSPHFSIIAPPKSKEDLFLICSSDGIIEIRTPQLTLIRTRKLLNFHSLSFLEADLNGDEIPELVVTGSQNDYSYCCIFDLDLSLKSLVRLNYAESISKPGLLHDKEKQSAQLLLQCDENYYILNFKKQLAAYLPLPLVWIAFIVIAFLVGLIIWLLIHLREVRMTSGYEAMHNVFNNLRECVILLDHEGRILHFNQEIARLGVPVTENIAGQSYKSLLLKTDLAEISQMLDQTYKNKIPLLRKELTLLQHYDPVNLIVYIAFFPQGIMHSPGRIVLIRRITEVVEHERELAWATMANRLAHEIKSPLSTIKLSAQQIESQLEVWPREKEKSRKYLQHVLRQVDRLTKTAENFLKLAQLSKTVFMPIDINALLLQCLDEMELKINPKIKVTTAFDPDLKMIHGDEDMLIIAIQNLIENSLNAMPDGGRLIITSKMRRSNPLQNTLDQVRIRIADSGVGMSKAHLQLLFQPFVSHTKGGTGLGLVIVQKIIRDHEGQLSLRSAASKGTVISISLPVL